MVVASLVVNCCAIKERHCCITIIRCGRSTGYSIARRPLWTFAVYSKV